MNRLRLTYTKSKEASYISSSDLVVLLDKLLTRVGVNVEYTSDNTPNIVIASPLPLGIDSTAEMCDITITEYIDTSFVIKGLNQILPTGIVAMSAEYISDNTPNITDGVYASVYEIIPQYEDVQGMTNREYLDMRAWYRDVLNEYMHEEKMLVLVKSETRNERIDIKPSIFDYTITINDALHVTVATGTEYAFNPNYIMDGFLEYIDKKISYRIRRTKILYR